MTQNIKYVKISPSQFQDFMKHVAAQRTTDDKKLISLKAYVDEFVFVKDTGVVGKLKAVLIKIGELLTTGSITREIISLEDGNNMDTLNMDTLFRDLQGIDFTDTDLGDFLTFQSTCFAYSNLTNVNLAGLCLNRSDLSHTNLTNTNLTNVEFDGANFTNANLTNSNLSNSHLVDANFTDANLTNANLTNSNLSHANFYNANLTNVNFRGTSLSKWTVLDGAYSDVFLDLDSAIHLGTIMDWN